MQKKDANKRVGAKIKRIREAKMLTRDELAEMINLTSSHLGLIERGERGITARNLYVMSDALQTPVGAFFTDDKAPRPERGPAMKRDEINRKRITALLDHIKGTNLEHLRNVVDSMFVLLINK